VVSPCKHRTLSHMTPRKKQHREANGVHDYIKERTIRIGNYVVETRQTVRLIAKEFGVSKSTVHKDLTERLPEINEELAKKEKERKCRLNKKQSGIVGEVQRPKVKMKGKKMIRNDVKKQVTMVRADKYCKASNYYKGK